MHHLIQSWTKKFDEHEALLQELETSLRFERKALLKNELQDIAAANLAKDKAIRKLDLYQQSVVVLKENSIAELGLAPQSDLDQVFRAIPNEDAKQLLSRRIKLQRLSKAISKLNQFNHECLQALLLQINSMRRIFGDLNPVNHETYSAMGQSRGAEVMGRLSSRSL